MRPDERRPSIAQRHRYLRGQGRTLPLKLALVGARGSAAGDHLDGRIVHVRNRAESMRLFEGGSMLDLMVRMVLASGQLARNDRTPGGTPQLYCLPLPPVSGQGKVKATQKLQLQGTATNSASVTLHVQDLAVRVPVSKGESVATVAERLALYHKRVETECAYLATAADDTLTLTAREPGTWGQQLYLGLDTSEVNGITAEVTRGEAGAGELDISMAKDALLAMDWHGVCFPGSAPGMPDVIKSYADDAWHYSKGHAPLVVTSHGGSMNEAVTAAKSYNHRHVLMAWAEHVPATSGVWEARASARSHDFEVAAAVAGRLFSRTKVNSNYNLATLPCYGRADNIERNALNETIAAGVTVVVEPVEEDTPGLILDPVVTMSRDEHGAPDTEWQPAECVRVTAEITRQLGAELSGFPTMDGDADTKASAVSAALAVLRAAAKDKLIKPPADDHVSADYKNINGSRRLVVDLAYAVIVGLDIVEVTHNISRA